MKTNFTILTLTLILILNLIACSQNNSSHQGETRMSTNDLFTVTLIEELNSKDVTAEIEINGNNKDVPDNYSTAELYIDDKFIGEFNNGFIEFTPGSFGDVECQILFLNADGTTAKDLTDIGQFYIETYYIAYNSSENGDVKEAIEDTEIVLTPSNVSLGSSDMLWLYNLRIPYGKELSFTYVSEKLTDINPNFGNNKLEVHFRYDDYKNRSELYPDEPYFAKYIDAETDKWISSPVTLSHGIHNLYVCPNLQTDRNKISVIHSGEHNGSFTANYKSIINWPAK